MEYCGDIWEDIGWLLGITGDYMHISVYCLRELTEFVTEVDRNLRFVGTRDGLSAELKLDDRSWAGVE